MAIIYRDAIGLLFFVVY